MHADLKLGELIHGEQYRDCIHIAVAPVVAGEGLSPGMRVGLNDAGEAIATRHPVVGIVDPYLRETVSYGAKFWLFLLPNTVTGMRHHWQHPAFGESFDARDKTPDMHASEKWLRDFADRARLHYDTMMEAAETFLQYGDYYVEYGSEYARDAIFDCGVEEFWKHYEIVTGKKVPDEKRDGYVFSCSC